MAPTIHVIRHAQAVHNVTHNFQLRDPELTEMGYKQCKELAAGFAKLGNVELVFASPMQRTIQTALATFETYTQTKQIVLLPDLQEHDEMPTGIGSSLDDLLHKFGGQPVDFSFMTMEWTDKSPQSRYAIRFVAERARSTRLFLRSVAQRYRDTDANIVVITHGLYIDHLIKPDNNMFKNAEYRSYYFDQIAGDDNRANLVEKPCSIARRQKAAAARKFELPPVFGVKLPSFGGLQPNTPEVSSTAMPGTVPTFHGGQLPSPPHIPALSPFQAMPGIVPSIEDEPEPFYPAWKGGMKPEEPMTISNTSAPSMSLFSPKPTVPEPAWTFNNLPKINTESSGASLFKDLPKKKTTGEPLFNPWNKKQKTHNTTGNSSLFDLPGKNTNKSRWSEEWSALIQSNKQKVENAGNF
ncbi:histidine phosphatase superfamily [Xylaria acuta]|nr:histidine phosphatase superfamily [Xylaria acuta]